MNNKILDDAKRRKRIKQLLKKRRENKYQREQMMAARITKARAAGYRA